MTDPHFTVMFRAACSRDVAEFRRQHDAWREEWQRQQELKTAEDAARAAVEPKVRIA